MEDDILQQRGARAKIAKQLGCHPSLPYKWQRVPANRLIDVASILGVQPCQLRPDLYPPAKAIGDDSGFASMQHIGD